MSVMVDDGGAVARHRLGLFFVTLSAVSWSSSGYFTRLLPLDPWTILFWRGSFAGLTGLIFIVMQEGGGTWRAFRGIGRNGLLFCLCSTGAMTCFIPALHLTSVAQVAVIYAVVPFIAASMAWIIMRERASNATLIASGVAVLGVIVTTAAGGSAGSLAGEGLSLLMAVFASGMIVIGRLGASVPLVPAACLSTFLGALIVLPFAHPLAVHPIDLLRLAVFGFSNMGLGLVLFIMGARLIPAAQTALISTLETPLSAFWVWVAFSETPTTGTLIGGAIVLLAVVGNTARDMITMSD